MKKILIVLLMAVLAAGFAFADISVSGSVKAGVCFDFEKKVGGFGVYNSGAKMGANWTFAKTTISLDTGKGGVEGTKDVYAEVAVSVALEGALAETDKNFATYEFTIKDLDFEKMVANKWFDSFGLKATVKLEKAQIVTKNFTIDLLYQNVGADYATNVIEKSDFDYGLAGTKEEIPGMTLHINDYDIGFGAWHGPDADAPEVAVTTVVAGVQSPEYAVADGVVARFALGSAYGKVNLPVIGGVNNILAGTSLKFAYTSDNLKATLTSDLSYTGVFFEDKELDDAMKEAQRAAAGSHFAYSMKDFGFDVALNASIYPVDIDVYFAKDASVKGEITERKFYDGKKISESVKADKTVGTIEKLLSARLKFDLAKIVEDIPATLTVTGHNLLDSTVVKTLPTAEITDGPNFETMKYISDGPYVKAKRSLDIDVTTTAIPETTLTVYAHDILTDVTATIGAKVENKSIENVAITAEGEYSLDNDAVLGINKGGYAKVGVSVSNIADMVDAYVKGGVAFPAVGDVTWGIACGASTEKIIENAKLMLDFNWNPNTKKLTGAKNESIFAGVEIKF